jgi:hypothetical protein
MAPLQNITMMDFLKPNKAGIFGKFCLLRIERTMDRLKESRSLGQDYWKMATEINMFALLCSGKRV